MSKSEIERVQITPTLAEKWLQQIPVYQRKIDDNQVNKIVRAIVKGQWQENGATIVFNSDGELLDGQHRLKAISLAGKSVGSLVVRDLSTDEAVFRTIGDEKARKLRDFIKSPNALIVAAVVNMQWMVSQNIWPIGTGGKTVIPIQESMKLVDKWGPTMQEIINAIKPAGIFLGQKSFAVFLVLYYTKIKPIDNPEKVACFFTRVADGIELTSSSPIYQLRKRYLSVTKGSRIDRLSGQALIVKALHLYLDDAPCQSLRWSNKEQFPKLRGMK